MDICPDLWYGEMVEKYLCNRCGREFTHYRDLSDHAQYATAQTCAAKDRPDRPPVHSTDCPVHPVEWHDQRAVWHSMGDRIHLPVVAIHCPDEKTIFMVANCPHRMIIKTSAWVRMTREITHAHLELDRRVLAHLKKCFGEEE